MPLSPFYGNVDVVGAYDQARAKNAAIEDMGLRRQMTLAQLLQQRQAQAQGAGFREREISLAEKQANAPKAFAPPEILVLTERLKGLAPDDPARPYIEQRLKQLGPKAEATKPSPRVHNVPGGYLEMDEQGKPGKFVRTEQDRPAAGTRAPVGFEFNPDGTLRYIKGGPKDPTINLTGGRESVYVQRMMMGANQAAKDLSNVVQLPLTATTGFFGGRRQGAGLFDAGKEVLANKATGQDAQAYNAMATGFQRSLAQIESAGLMPSGSLTHQMDAVLFKEGDTNLTKLHKLAQTRQIVEAGMEVIQSNPRVSPQEKEKVHSVLASIRKSVPFTHSDLIALQSAHMTNPNTTLKDVLANKPKPIEWTPEKEKRLQELRNKAGGSN